MEKRHDSPGPGWKWRCMLAAIDKGLKLHSEAFGRHGVCIDVWRGDVKIGYRKSWKAAYKLILTQPDKA